MELKIDCVKFSSGLLKVLGSQKLPRTCKRNVRGAKEQLVIKKTNDRRHKVIVIVRHKRDFILSNLPFSSVVSCNLFQEVTDRKHLFSNLCL